MQAGETDSGVREALTMALRDVIRLAGAQISPPMLERIIASLQQDAPGQTDEALTSRASALGAAATFAPAADFDALLTALLTVRLVVAFCGGTPESLTLRTTGH